jgi:hypothetical protein
MKDVGYGEKRTVAPPVSRPVDVPIMTAAVPAAAAPVTVKEKTPTQPQSRTAPNVRHRRESRHDPTAEPKASPLPHLREKAEDKS